MVLLTIETEFLNQKSVNINKMAEIEKEKQQLEVSREKTEENMAKAEVDVDKYKNEYEKLSVLSSELEEKINQLSIDNKIHHNKWKNLDTE